MQFAPKLEQLEKRFEELNHLMSNPAVISDGEQYRKISKERADLEDPVGFAKSVAGVLTDRGVWVLEMSYMPLMLAIPIPMSVIVRMGRGSILGTSATIPGLGASVPRA